MIRTVIGECGDEFGATFDVDDVEPGFGGGVDIYLNLDPLLSDKQANQPPSVYSVDVGALPPGGSAEFVAWKRGFTARVKVIVQAYQAGINKIPASEVWLLAASTGGLQAVAQFLSQARQRPGFGFVYAQHIEVEHQEQLVKLVRRHSPWGAQIGGVGDYLAEGYVTIISPGERVSVGAGGRIISSDQNWSGRYRPSIDDLSGELAANYRQCSGMIVFTGMGDDGVMGSKTIKAGGGSVWVQAPGTCAAPALPEAVRVSGSYDYCADIERLSNKFNECIDKPPLEALAQ
ncbi:MAG: chemotaxis protein CheB [Porticoccaceae bacterium]|nr:chemotaxis protein CheB [Porticoccaceae bacterium]